MSELDVIRMPCPWRWTLVMLGDETSPLLAYVRTYALVESFQPQGMSWNQFSLFSYSMMRTSVGFSAVGEGRSSAALIWVTSWFNLGNKGWFEQDFGKLTGSQMPQTPWEVTIIFNGHDRVPVAVTLRLHAELLYFELFVYTQSQTGKTLKRILLWKVYITLDFSYCKYCKIVILSIFY